MSNNGEKAKYGVTALSIFFSFFDFFFKIVSRRLSRRREKRIYKQAKKGRQREAMQKSDE